MKKEDLYMDDRGYLRFKDSKKTIHRWIAYKYIYKPNKQKYILPFRKYQIHHKDGNKTNNNVDNLELYIDKQHQEIHKDLIKEQFTLRVLAFWGVIALGIIGSIILFLIIIF